MKKFFIFAFAVVAMASCTSVHETATTRPVKAPIVAGASADMEIVGKKISYTYKTTGAIRRGGFQNCVNAAVREALAKNGNADVLVESQEAIVQRNGLFGTKIKSVTVTGFPAVYKNFKSMDQDAAIKAMSAETPAVKQRTSIFGIFGR